jgi:RHS repeat-associated protein
VDDAQGWPGHNELVRLRPRRARLGQHSARHRWHQSESDRDLRLHRLRRRRRRADRRRLRPRRRHTESNNNDPLNAYRYTAKRLDTGAGDQLDMGARRFAPDVGRFLQVDVFNGALADLSLSTDPLTANRYGLAGGNPLSFVEWDGHLVYPDGGGYVAPPPESDGGGAGTSTSTGDTTGGSSVPPRVWTGFGWTDPGPYATERDLNARDPLGLDSFEAAPECGPNGCGDLGTALLGMATLTSVVALTLIAAPVIAGGAAAVATTGSLSAGCATACPALLILGAEITTVAAGVPGSRPRRRRQDPSVPGGRVERG